MIIVFFIYILLGLKLSISYPRHFVSFYILATTKFLGFFDPEAAFVFQGLGLGMPSLNIIVFTVVLFRGKLRRISKDYRVFAYGLIGILIYGILRPLIMGIESWLEAVMASKEFWTIGFFLYLAKFRRKIPVGYLIKLVVPLGLYLSSTYILFELSGLAPPVYINGNVFKAYYPTYISLAWFFVFYFYLIKNIGTNRFLIYSLVFSIGLILAGHSSITITTITLIGLSTFILRGKVATSVFGVLRFTIAIITLALLTLYSDSINNFVSDVLSKEDSAISSREKYNVFRWDAIMDSPYLGYGFVHKNAPINEKYIDFTSNRFTERFEVIDSGYVDVLIKFGIFGLLAIISLWLYIIKKAFGNKTPSHFLAKVCGLFILQYFLINYTWSVFTYSHGLIPGIMVAYIIISVQKANYLWSN
tara:strand:+ start:21838 stop:23088 length:1251 start_codon:yes stop_codon:yes gene_type:complete